MNIQRLNIMKPTQKDKQYKILITGQELDELMLSYAATVHKSQGSEYPAVVMPIHTQHYALLQKNLLYTGITRARKLVVLVGTLKAVAIATKRMESKHRITLLKERLGKMISTHLGE